MAPRRIVFLPPLPLNAFEFNTMVLGLKRISLEDLKKLVEELRNQGYEIVNYIRHPSTVKLLSEKLNVELKVSSELYKYQHGDVIVLIGLKKPIRGQEVEVKPDDLDIALVWCICSS